MRQRVGSDTLTIEPRLQSAAERAIVALGKAGAIVALEPDTGVGRALFSTPGERGDPMLGAHVPASTWKPFTRSWR